MHWHYRARRSRALLQPGGLQWLRQQRLGARLFLANWIGRCRYSNIVAPYYRAQHPKSYYTDERIPQPQRALELINEALSHWRAQGFDFTPLTPDNQGFVYAMNVYYAGPVVNNWAKGLWPHAHHLDAPVALAPGHSAFDYQFTAMGSELTLGTLCHENGHMLCDYPDLYDYGYESSGIGGYCLMRGRQPQPEEPGADRRVSQTPVGWGAQRHRAHAWRR
jgi:M6 family metalloprotease-like protein